MEKFDSYIITAGLDSKPHQREGVEWMLNNETTDTPLEGVRGGLVADEMGLGKTIMVLGTLVSNFKRSTLIVVPLALVDQWWSEIYKTTGHNTMVYHGNSKKEIDKEMLENAPIVITTYGHIQRKNKKQPQGKMINHLHDVNWDRVVYDEAHHLRNSKTTIWRGAKMLRAGISWLITGTPIQNRKSDFYSLCGIMGYKPDFYTCEDNLLSLVGASIIKRKKSEVGVVLPERRMHMVDVQWGNENERVLSEDIHNLLTFSNLNTGRGVNAAMASLGNQYLALLIRARQCCVLPSLMAPIIEKFIEDGLLENDEDLDIDDALKHSSKIDSVVGKILERKDNQRPKIVFCHYRGEIDIVQTRLIRGGLHTEKIDGRVSRSERERILSEPCDALILQIMTGCEGLNLQEFKEVYFISPHWNPAVEDQAIARCHRIGQIDDVDIFCFQMAPFDGDGLTATLDNYSANVQKAKRELFMILDKNKNSI